jgi:glutamate formiminotransferase / formiminotetrahydrofolate cyclodeaminase
MLSIEKRPDRAREVIVFPGNRSSANIRSLMNRLIECVPNFSEGRDPAKVDALVTVLSSVPGAWILDRTSDADHNRSVITLAGEPEAVAEAAIRGAGKAAELIDLMRHTGVHPRIGATDVIPFIPLEGVSVEECVALARHVGQQLWDRYRIPVYFYEAAATRPERVHLENVRKGQFEGLREGTLGDPDRSPDIGEPRLHPTAGATAVGVRKLLIAYNVLLNTGDVSLAKKIARAIRFSSGGLRHVKAIGVELKTRGLAQVSINLTDFEQTPLHRVFEMVKREAERHGCGVAGSEIIGLVPRKALDSAAEYYLQLENFSPSRVLENRLAAVAGATPFPPAGSSEPGAALQTLLEALRASVQELSGCASNASQETRLGLPEAAKGNAEKAAELYLEAASIAAQIYERAVQLEAAAAPSILLDLSMVRHMSLAATRGALENAEGILPTLRNATTAASFKSRAAGIEAQLKGTPVPTGNR